MTIDIVNRLRFDAIRCETQFSKGVAGNITEAADEIERLRSLSAAQTSVERGSIIEKCAKIAEPWPGFWLDDSSSDAERAVVAVRTEIAAKIRAMADGDEKCA